VHLGGLHPPQLCGRFAGGAPLRHQGRLAVGVDVVAPCLGLAHGKVLDGVLGGRRDDTGVEGDGFGAPVFQGKGARRIGGGDRVEFFHAPAEGEDGAVEIDLVGKRIGKEGVEAALREQPPARPGHRRMEPGIEGLVTGPGQTVEGSAVEAEEHRGIYCKGREDLVALHGSGAASGEIVVLTAPESCRNVTDDDDVPDIFYDPERDEKAAVTLGIGDFRVQFAHREGFYLFPVDIKQNIVDFANQNRLVGVYFHPKELGDLCLHHYRFMV